MTDERGRGIFTDDDREYLRGEKEFKHRQSEHNAKKRINERLRNAFLDFNVLVDHFDEDQYENVLNEVNNDAEFRRGAMNALAFIFRGTAGPSIEVKPNLGTDHDGQKQISDTGLFDDLLEDAYVVALLTKYDFITADFEPPIVTGDQFEGIHTFRQMAEAGEDLSPRYIKLLLQHDVIDSEEVQKAVRKQLLEDVPPRSEANDEQ